MREFLTSTQSICRECRRPVSARLFKEESRIWMEKHCPEHGVQTALVYSDVRAYLELGRFFRKASVPLAFATSAEGCPDSCGFCPEHEQHVCLPILEITNHCNWSCPICLVRNGGTYHWSREDVARVLDGLIRSEGQIDVVNLAGGEPTISPNFRQIIEECVSRKEILRVSVSTNGSVLVRDIELLRFLGETQVIVSLQFDGMQESIYQALRGRDVLKEKLELIDLCQEFGVLMSLTATVARGVNDRGIREVADLLFQRDHILSAMFQPAAYAGQATSLGRPGRAVTIPDVIEGLDGAGSGLVSKAHFVPLPCSHPACFSLAHYLKIGQNEFRPVKNMADAESYLKLIQNRTMFGTDSESFQIVSDAVYDLWSSPAGALPESQKTFDTLRRLISATTSSGYSPRRAVSVGERAVKSIFIHQFMDPDSFDLSRARKCCQVYPQLDGRLMPVCVYNCLKREHMV
jgi:7,8-dihydro-6-hydroxymethylpterin dimethyltransferase